MGDSRTWLFMLALGVINSFLVGFCQIKAEEKITQKGKKLVIHSRYDMGLVLLVVFGAGILTVTSFVRYCIPVPKLFIVRLVLLAVELLVIMLAVMMFFAISTLANIIAVRVYEADLEKRERRRKKSNNKNYPA